LGMMDAWHHEELPADGVMRVIEQGAGHRHRVLRTGVYHGMYFASILPTHSLCSGPAAGGQLLVCLAHTLFVTSASARWMCTTDSSGFPASRNNTQRSFVRMCMRCFLYAGYGFPSPAARFSHDYNMDRANATDDTRPMQYSLLHAQCSQPGDPSARALSPSRDLS
jgi:hypothetical protein